jgi:hypothetical protein
MLYLHWRAVTPRPLGGGRGGVGLGVSHTPCYLVPRQGGGGLARVESWR